MQFEDLSVKKKDNYKNGLIFDGYVRRDTQVEIMSKLSEEILEKPIGNVLAVHANLESLEERTVARRHCKSCKKDYNLTAPKNSDRYPIRLTSGKITEYFCNNIECLKPVSWRNDDKPEKVIQRLEQYKQYVNKMLMELQNAGINLYIVSGDLPNELFDGKEDVVKDTVNKAFNRDTQYNKYLIPQK